MKNKGFSLIELLVVISIIGILAAFSLVTLGGTRKTGRDGKRKADIEQIRSALEIYRADCKLYPASLPNAGLAFTGSCPTSNTYLAAMPADPTSGYKYAYLQGAGTNTYTLCAHSEFGSGNLDASCGVDSPCGTGVCNYKQVNP